MKKLLLLFVLSLILSGGIALAEETVDATQEIALDEEVTAQDLDVGDPLILPDNPLYFFKNIARTIQSAFTFDSVKKAELKEKFANEKLIELKKMVEENKSREKVEKAIRNYQNELEEVGRAAEQIKERAEESTKVSEFLDKFIQQQVLHNRILQKLEEQVPAEIYEKIAAARENHLKKFGEVMTRLENKGQIQERLEKNLQEVKGSKFKDFKSLEILKQLEEKIPEEAKNAVRGAQETIMLKLKDTLEVLPTQKQEAFQKYIEDVSGQKINKLEIIEQLRVRVSKPLLQQQMIQLKERVMQKAGKPTIE